MNGSNDARVSRRTMVIGLGALGATAMAATIAKVPDAKAPTLPTWWTKSATSLATGAMAQWTAKIGTVFTLKGVANDVAITLDKVVALNSSGKRPKTLARQTAFLATFKPAKDVGMIADRIYQIGNPTLGAMNIYLAPDGAGRLQAVFN